MNNKILQNINWKTLLYFCPILIVLFYFFYQSLFFNLHDFSNSYFSARMIQEGISPTQLFDIYAFNSYIWKLGYLDYVKKANCCCIPNPDFCVVQPCRFFFKKKHIPGVVQPKTVPLTFYQ